MGYRLTARSIAGVSSCRPHRHMHVFRDFTIVLRRVGWKSRLAMTSRSCDALQSTLLSEVQPYRDCVQSPWRSTAGISKAYSKINVGNIKDAIFASSGG